MKMVEEAKEGFRARNIDQWQKGEPNEQGLTEGIEKSVVHVLEENGEVLGMIDLYDRCKGKKCKNTGRLRKNS